MLNIKERFIVDELGQPVSVVLDIADYRLLQTRLTELESRQWRKPNGELDLSSISDEDLARLNSVFATLAEEQIDEAEQGQGPYVWLIDMLDELGCRRLSEEAKSDSADFVPLETAWDEVERLRAQ